MKPAHLVGYLYLCGVSEMDVQNKRALDKFLGACLVTANVFAARALGVALRRNHSVGRLPAHLVFIKLLGLGSVFLASDAVASARQAFPNTKFILLGGRGFSAGLGPTGLFDEIWEINDRTFFSLISSVFRILVRIWGLQNRWVVDLEVYSRLTTVFSLWTCSRNRFGFTLEVVSFRNRMNTHNQYFNRYLPVSRNYTELVKQLGVATSASFRFPGYEPQARKPASHYPFIAINNTCSTLSLERKMPDGLLAEVCAQLLETHALVSLAFLGAPSDRAETGLFVSRYLNHYMNEGRLRILAGELGFESYYQFLYEKCALMLSIDSAPLHIARKLGLPVVSVWGPTRPETYLGQMRKGRDGPLDAMVYLGKPCSPCVHHTETLPCGGDNTCMKHMAASDILQAVRAVYRPQATNTV